MSVPIQGGLQDIDNILQVHQEVGIRKRNTAKEEVPHLPQVHPAKVEVEVGIEKKIKNADIKNPPPLRGLINI